MARKKKIQPRLAVIDFETDPFVYDVIPKPFLACFYDGERFVEFWGDDAAERLIEFLFDLSEPHVIYAHNGGKFDFMFLLRLGALSNPILPISARIVSARLGIHELRDSYAIMPLSLAKIGGKLEIDITKLFRAVRKKHKAEIMTYCRGDCSALYDKVAKFRERFGDKLTVGGMAIKELQKLHPDFVPHRGVGHDGAISKQERKQALEDGIVLGQYHLDKGFRRFYFGGRVQCFETGVVMARPNKPLKFYDINSSYPKSMRDFNHPASQDYLKLGPEAVKTFDPKIGKFRNFPTAPYFMRFIGTNRNAIPKRGPEGELSFDIPNGEFFACSHELEIACKYGLVTVDQILEVRVPVYWGRFEKFVDTYVAEKIAAKLVGDDAGELFAKLILNSAYGKYATNAFKFKDWYIFDCANGTPEHAEEFKAWKAEALDPEIEKDYGNFEIWCAQTVTDDRAWFDVAIAASITSASRALLLEAIINCKRPIYCDTDSVLCEEMGKVKISETELGAWKFEGSTLQCNIAGKKMYAAKLMEAGKDGKPKVKLASKGARMSYDQIEMIARGETIEWKSDAPNFKMNGDTKFIKRKIRMTH